MAVTTHGDNRKGLRTPEYQAWADIIKRCENDRHKDWPDYGGRGIRICDRWRQSYSAFLADVGRRPSSSNEIDRIDNDGHYEPGNVRWTTRTVQLSNRRRRHPGQCRAGHAFTPENTIERKDGRRNCRACQRRRSAEFETRRDPVSRRVSA